MLSMAERALRDNKKALKVSGSPFVKQCMSTLLKAGLIALIFGGGWALIYLIFKALG